MSLQRDTAEKLNIVMPSIDSATRRYVYVASGHLPSMEAVWLKVGGETDFIYCEADPNKVGIVIFKLERAPYVGPELARRLRPFYAKAGTESNVFEFDPVLKLFTRRNPEWLEHPGRIQE